VKWHLVALREYHSRILLAMMTKTLRRELQEKTTVVCVAMLLLLFSTESNSSCADDLQKKLIAETRHDFGAVARGAKSSHRFTIKNPYSKPIIIASVRSSCGCTTASFSTKEIAPFGSGEIIADFNTRSFLGKKSATITVSFTQPYRSEIQLIVSGYIRSDIVFNPGSINFQNVDSGVAKTLSTTISYAGSSVWKILDVQSGCKHLSADLVEIERSSKLVKYRLTTTIDESAPVGYLNTELIVVTNDRKMNKVPLTVVANVKSPLSVSPSQISIPSLENGIVKKTRLVLRGNEEFQITAVQCEDPRVEIKVASTPKKVHLATVTFSSTGRSNLPRQIPIVFQTSLGAGNSVTVPITLAK